MFSFFQISYVTILSFMLYLNISDDIDSPSWRGMDVFLSTSSCSATVARDIFLYLDLRPGLLSMYTYMSML